MQRPFGGHSYPRACMAADKTGFFEMQALYDNLVKYNNFKRYDECFVTSLLLEGGRFCLPDALDAATGEFFVLRGKALLIASGGLGNLYGFSNLGFALLLLVKLRIAESIQVPQPAGSNQESLAA